MKNLNKHKKEQRNTETENLRVELIALKTLSADQIYLVKKRSNNKDDEHLIKILLDLIETAKQNNHSDKGKREFLTPRKTVKMSP